jgi:Peptidase A4 family
MEQWDGTDWQWADGLDDDVDAVAWHSTPERRSVPSWLRAHPAVAAYTIVAVVICTVLGLVTVTVSGTSPSRSAVPPNQAGYLWCCNVRDVSASWVVPRLVHPAPESAEAVWIGAQTEDGDFFLQVGTNEYVTGTTPQYQAFWSDGPLNGAPQIMGRGHTLSPGDVVGARLSHTAAGWVVTFADRTRGWSTTAHPHYGVSSANALAEWIEEDPVAVDPARGSSLFPMAATLGTTVSHLLVNDAPPLVGATEPETFRDRAEGLTFSPTALVHDAFGFRPW